jgi:hypothetical protein
MLSKIAILNIIIPRVAFLFVAKLVEGGTFEETLGTAEA